MRQAFGFFGLDMNGIITQSIHAALCQTELLPHLQETNDR